MQFTQQGQKLVGKGDDPSEQGQSVALSADGNTAIVAGAPLTYPGSGAAWVFTRTSGVWRSGAKLVGTPATRVSSVAFSGDGNTAILGGYEGKEGHIGRAFVLTRIRGVWTQRAIIVGTPAGRLAKHSGSVALSADGKTAFVGAESGGAGWVFARVGSAWTQEGPGLVVSGYVGENGGQGQSVALSGDGNTAIAGGPDDNDGVGAAWVFTRSEGVWTQQGAKLVGTGAGTQGSSVALSADGDTAIVGGSGAAVFTRSGGVWTQQGTKLVGTGAVGDANQGASVALSADGNIAILGGPNDNWARMPDGTYSGVGAAWIFTRSGDIWTQQGAKVVGTGAVGRAQQGSSVAISADGKTVLVGGPNDNGSFDMGWVGAAWVYVDR